jgi:hypothetical protein
LQARVRFPPDALALPTKGLGQGDAIAPPTSVTKAINNALKVAQRFYRDRPDRIVAAILAARVTPWSFSTYQGS